MQPGTSESRTFVAFYSAQLGSTALLKSVLCRRARHDCGGVYVCSEFSKDLLDIERYEVDLDQQRDLIRKRQAVRSQEGTDKSHFAIA